MHKMILSFLLIAPMAFAQVATTGLPSPQMSGVGAPPSSTCALSSLNVFYTNIDPTIASGRLWLCLATGWQNLPTVTFFTGSGTANGNVKCMAYNVTSTTGTGAFSFNLTPLGITTLLTVQLTSVSTGSGANQLNQAYVYPAPTVTTVAGFVAAGNVLASLGATISPQTVSTTVYGFFCGT